MRPRVDRFTNSRNAQIHLSSCQLVLSKNSNLQKFRTIREVQSFREMLMTDLGQSFNTNALKISLNYKEDRVAAMIISKFPVVLDDSIVEFAIQTQSLIFLQQFLFQLFHSNMFYNQKNHLLSPLPKHTQSQSALSEQQQTQLTYRQLSIDEVLFKANQLLDFKKCEKFMFAVLNWKFEPNGNVLQLLCEMGHERVSAHFMNQYPTMGDWDFFMDCIQEEKSHFLKHALREQFFDLDYMRDSRVVGWIFDKIRTGNNLMFSLNLLLYTDFKKWDPKNVEKLIKYAKLIITHNLDTNLLLISTNPIMTLGLMIQYLKTLKRDFNVYDTECVKLIERLETLGKLIIENLQFDHVEEIFMDRDFMDRSVLNIVTDNQIMRFIVISKLRFLLDKIWDGRDSDLIDGKTSHFSKTKYMLYHEIKRLKGVPVRINDIIGDNFKPNIEDFNFIYQMKFRMQSIKIIFMKDFFCATFIVGIFQYINYSYLSLFNQRKYQHLDDVAKLKYITDSLNDYKQFNFVGTILSLTYFLNMISRVIYNAHSKRKISLDLWMVFDMISGGVNIAAFNIIGLATAESFLQENTKRFYDYYMIIALIISWLRFFSYFLVINIISKVTLTLFMMLKETLNFMLILSCYLMLMTTVFATLFRDANTPDAEDYQSLFTTIRSLIDYFLANYQNKYMGNYDTSHSVLVIAHVTISNIFLLNFLVAILQTVYEIMIRNGDFYAIQYSYIFITKYMKAMEENNSYDKLILYPPPLNILLIPLMLVSFSKKLTKKTARVITLAFFWLENLFLILLFFLYLLAHDPFILVKIYYQIFTKIDGVLSTLLYLTVWTICGLPYCLFVNLVDTLMLINILCLENSMVYDQGETERNRLLKHKFYIYRDIMRAMSQLIGIAEDQSVLFNKRQKLQRFFTQKKSFTEKILEAEKEMKIDDIYIVRKELIIAAYEQISSQNPYTLAFRKALQETMLQKSSYSLFQEFKLDDAQLKLAEKQDPQLTRELRQVLGRLMLSHNRDNIQELAEFMVRDKTENKDLYGKQKIGSGMIAMRGDEIKILDSFLNRFTIMQQNQESTTINLALVQKVFPKVVTTQSVKKIDLLHFARMQKILISFFNDDQDEMFNYYDARMTRRLVNLKRTSLKNMQELDWINSRIKEVYEYISWQEAAFNYLQKQTTAQDISQSQRDMSPDTARVSVLDPKELPGNKKSSLVSFQQLPQFLTSSEENPFASQIQSQDTGVNTDQTEGKDMLTIEQEKNFKKVIEYKLKKEKLEHLAKQQQQSAATSGAFKRQHFLSQLATKTVHSAQILAATPLVPKPSIHNQTTIGQRKQLPHFSIMTADQLLTQLRAQRKKLERQDSEEASQDDMLLTATNEDEIRKRLGKTQGGHKKSQFLRQAKNINDSFRSDASDLVEKSHLTPPAIIEPKRN